MYLQKPTIENSYIYNEKNIKGRPFIKDSKIKHNSFINGNAYIFNSIIEDSTVSNNATILNSELSRCKVLSNAFIGSSQISGFITISGNCKLYYFEHNIFRNRHNKKITNGIITGKARLKNIAL